MSLSDVVPAVCYGKFVFADRTEPADGLFCLAVKVSAAEVLCTALLVTCFTFIVFFLIVLGEQNILTMELFVLAVS